MSAHLCFPNFQSVSFSNFSLLLFTFHNYFYASASLFLLLSFPFPLFISSSHFFPFDPLLFLLFPRLLLSNTHLPILFFPILLYYFFLSNIPLLLYLPSLASIISFLVLSFSYVFSYFYFYFISYFLSVSHSPFLFSVNFYIFSSFVV